jgi:hypothetical protein
LEIGNSEEIVSKTMLRENLKGGKGKVIVHNM